MTTGKTIRNAWVVTFVTVLGIALMSASVQAAPIAVANHSFEDPDVAEGTPGAPTSWTVSGTTGLVDIRGGLLNVTDTTPDDDGEQCAWSNIGYLYQVLTTKILPNTTYTLTVDVGDRTNTDFPASAIRLGVGSTYGANLLTAVVVANTVPFNAAVGPGDDDTDGWETWVSTFTTGASVADDYLRVELVCGGTQGLYDNVRLEVADPPTTGTVIYVK